jgi:hypothetical protein
MSSNTDHKSLISRPYAERQFVVVMPDEIVEAQRQPQEGKADKSFDWSGLAMSAVGLYKGGVIGLGISAATEAYAAWQRARANGIDALQIKMSEAQQLCFPPAHPRVGVLYVAHPGEPNVYYTVASFHRVAFEHKFAEAVDLLMSLGATKITVEHVSGWDSKFASTLSVSLPSGPGSASVGSNSGSQSTLLFEASLPDNKSRFLPPNLVWYPHEQTWKSIANGRLIHGLNEFSLIVNYQDDFGVNAGLKVNATKAGLDLGGNFENHVATSWKLFGTFAPAE